jgi:hypothetical protein
MAAGKEWLIGAPEFKDLSFSLDDLRRLAREKKLLGTDLVLKEGGVWRAARDYGELAALFEEEAAPAARQGPKIVIEPPEQRPVAPPRPARLLSSGPPPPPPPPQTGTRSIPAQKPLRKTSVIEPPTRSPTRKTQIVAAPKPEPPRPAEPPPPPPEQDKSKEETAVEEPVPAPRAPVSETEETKDDESAPRPEPQAQAPKTVRSRRERRLPPPSEPVIAAMQLSEFKEKDLLRGLWKILHPVNLLVGFTMAFLCPMLSVLFDVTSLAYLVPTVLYFAWFVIAHGAICFTTRCRVEKTSGLSLVVPYVKRSFALAGSVVLAEAILASLSLGLTVARQGGNSGVNFALLCVVSLAFALTSLAFTMTGGYWNAILAVEVCGPGEGFSKLVRLYRTSFRMVAAHSLLALLLSFASFVLMTLPCLSVVLMNFGKSNAVPMDSILLPIFFGLGTGLAVSTLAVGNVLSYLYIRQNRMQEPPAAPPAAEEIPKKDQVPAEGAEGPPPKSAETTQIEAVVPDPTKESPKPEPPLPPAPPPPEPPSSG